MAPSTVQQAFDLASRHHQTGQFAQAEILYRQILAQIPNHPETLHMLGVLACQAGHGDAAVDLIRQAVASKPVFPEAFVNLGLVLSGLGRFADAITAYRQAIALRPDFAQAYCNLGAALTASGQLDEAIAACRQAVALLPILPDAHNNLGNAFKEKGWHKEAIAAFRRAVEVNPTFAEGYNNLGAALMIDGQPEDAILACRRAIALRPNYANAYCNLGAALRDRGQFDEALAAGRHALALVPTSGAAHNVLGNVFGALGRHEEAIAAYHAAIKLNPHSAEAYNNLGTVLTLTGNPDEAITAIRKAIALDPKLAEACASLGSALQDVGRLDEAIASYRHAISLKPGLSQARSNLVYALLYHPEGDPQAVAAEHLAWGRRYSTNNHAQIRGHPTNHRANRRLRIGYVSPDFREHSVARFLLPLISHHDKNLVEIFAYANVAAADSVTQRFRDHVDTWHNILGESDAKVADMIRAEDIDILVDVAGHTAQNRLLLFTHKPAPIQVTFLGYPATTGLETMDYRLTDALADPPGLTEHYHSEKLYRLSPCAWCFEPRETPVLKRRTDGPITFGCFNNFSKVNEWTLGLWCQILEAMPSAKLMLKAPSLDSRLSQELISTFFARMGIPPDRVEMRGRTPDYEVHLGAYHQIDIALDTFPYHGTNTTCEALWMGVPVISLAGKSHVSRVGVSLLSNLGLQEFIADSPADYVRRAVGLGKDLSNLRFHQQSLRDWMRGSPLMNAKHFAQQVESAYREMGRSL